jgi:hypothetical protein
MTGSFKGADNILKVVTQGIRPIYIKPYREKKVWGVQGIGEYWYGAEKGEKSSVAQIENDEFPMDKLMERAAKELVGEKVIDKFGKMLPLTKILTPNNRLSVQFHDSKNELWVVTGINKDISGNSPYIILGFNAAFVEKYGNNITSAYHRALEKYGDRLNMLIDKLEEKGHKDILTAEKNAVKAAKIVKGKSGDIRGLLDEVLSSADQLNAFYNKRIVEIGDVIPVPSGTLHALGRGIQVLEPQIPGPTQSMEDGATYPVRYAFPGHNRGTASKLLDLDRVNEITPEVVKDAAGDVIEDTGSVKVEKLPGGFENKGMEVRRITLEKGSELMITDSKSDHLLAIVNNEGSAVLIVNNKEYTINKADPGESLMLVPASIRNFKVQAWEKTQIVDTFTPV